MTITNLLEGKVAVVTGGTRGIGLAIVKKYLEQGAKVALFGSRQETADKAVSTLLAETLEDEENDEIVLLEDGAVDLDDLFTTALVLSMDSKHVCSEDCKGLCATCGADLNEGPCGCRREIDPRLAALAQLLDKDE